MMPKHTVIAATVALMGLGILGNAGQMAQAYAPEGDLMKIKGYSPELIETTETQRSRQEWRQPSAPRLSPVERFFHNVYYGNWTGDVDDFGSQILRER